MDVRSVEAWQTGHASCAVSMTLQGAWEDQVALWAEFDYDTIIVVYCDTGYCAHSAVAPLRSSGFTEVTNAGAYDQNLPNLELICETCAELDLAIAMADNSSNVTDATSRVRGALATVPAWGVWDTPPPRASWTSVWAVTCVLLASIVVYGCWWSRKRRRQVRVTHAAREMDTGESVTDGGKAAGSISGGEGGQVRGRADV